MLSKSKLFSEGIGRFPRYRYCDVRSRARDGLQESITSGIVVRKTSCQNDCTCLSGKLGNVSGHLDENLFTFFGRNVLIQIKSLKIRYDYEFRIVFSGCLFQTVED